MKGLVAMSGDKVLILIFIIAILSLILTNCTEKEIVFVPVRFASCPGEVPEPAAPNKIRTTEDIAKYANQLQDALKQANKARDDCAAALQDLNTWIGGQNVRN